jgi:hypothetical protein
MLWPSLMGLFPHLRCEKLMEGISKGQARRLAPSDLQLPPGHLANRRTSHKPFLLVEFVGQTHSGGKRLFQLRQLKAASKDASAAEAKKHSRSLPIKVLGPIDN